MTENRLEMRHPERPTGGQPVSLPALLPPKAPAHARTRSLSFHPRRAEMPRALLLLLDAWCADLGNEEEEEEGIEN